MSKERHLLKFFDTPLSDELIGLSRPVEEYLGKHTFALTRVTNEGGFYHVSNQPINTEIFMTEKFYQNNPMIRHPDLYDEDLVFYNSEVINDQYEASQEAFLQRTQLDRKFFVLKKEREAISLFAFIFEENAFPNPQYFTRYQPALLKYCDHFLERWSKNSHKMERYLLDGKELIGTSFHQEKLQLTQTIEKDKLFEFGIQMGMIDKKVVLTRLERGCALKHLNGRPASKRILNLIGEKLGCNDSSELLKTLQNYQSLNLL